MISDLPENQIYILESRGKPFNADSFGQRFKKGRRQAGISDDLWFRDLRRTAITRLSDAGCTVPEIAAISGHSITEAQGIIDTYIVATKQLASNAINKLIVNQTKKKV